MAVGCNVPYTDRPWTAETWAKLERLQPDEITLTSFTDEGEVRKLCAMFPDALYHVRPRTGPQNTSWARTYADAHADILSYRSWETERSLAECLGTLIGDLPAGMHPRACHRITVLMGNEPTLEWAPPYPTMTAVKVMSSDYAEWYHEQAGRLRDEYAGVIGIAVAPAAEGDDGREMMYMSEAFRAGCYAIADSFADHNYFAINSGPVWSTTWGGRATRAMAVIGWDVQQRGRARVTESNDNGDGESYSAEDRARYYADYVTWAGMSNAYESVSLFTLPGAPDDDTKPGWWFITDAIIDAVCRARDGLSDMPIIPTAGVDIIPMAPVPIPDQHADPSGDPTEVLPMATPESDPMLDMVNGGQTLTADQLHEKRWGAYALPKLPTLPVWNPEFGFEGAWRKPENAWWGSPLTVAEDKLDTGDGTDPLAARVFANAVVIWRPGSGAEVLS
jgi:hypothetical protein